MYCEGEIPEGVSRIARTRSCAALAKENPPLVSVSVADVILPASSQEYTVPLCIAVPTVTAIGSSGAVGSSLRHE